MAVDTRWYDLEDSAKFVNLEGVEFREYQFNISQHIFDGLNTLVILPTGLGKTLIAVFAIAKIIASNRKALFLAPTKPLSEQHFATLSAMLKVDKGNVLLLTGATASKKRQELEKSAQVIVATPQTVTNDLKHGFFSMKDFGIVVFDECHRAVGKYAYTYIADECKLYGVQTLGLTASPGSNRERIRELLKSLDTEQIEARISTDPDVVRYVMPKYMRIIWVDKSEAINRIAFALRPIIESSLQKLNEYGLASARRFESIPRGRLIELGNTISKIQARNFKFAAMFSYIRLLDAFHAYDLLETEGIFSFLQYVESLNAREKKSRALESFLNDKGLIAAKRLAEQELHEGREHPKVAELVKLLKEEKGRKMIVFAQYRSTIKMIVGKLQEQGLSARAFVGKKEGVTQEQQKKTIADFRNGEFEILVSSSIGEEGLDIPTVDMVVFYEPIPSEIRNIQRRGRTGRLYAGEIVVLAARETRDVAYLFVSRNREVRMQRIVSELKSELAGKAARKQGEKQKRLDVV